MFSARKQVERSRTDPNMLVITYNSEHNHPWPTQRNALAGSTRSQPSKVDTTTGPQSPPPQKPTNEQKETINPKNTSSTTSAVDIIIQSAKEETGSDPDLDPGFEDGFSGSYKPIFPSHDHSEDSFFAELGEIETDSLDMFGFSGNNGPGHTGLDPFIFYDWDGSNDACVGSPGGAATRDANKNLC
ncbi:Probable WRKY transcription factor 14 [Striga hermonthica]|uniref:Probable WRKY transcription factor 14 n=1 Tax=Striga hermonthica TaxID=68872 RepID=A0A9N7N7S7_STRHE|nr:Probable WRKY transcription factor 14 [Striga hermonthica]